MEERRCGASERRAGAARRIGASDRRVSSSSRVLPDEGFVHIRRHPSSRRVVGPLLAYGSGSANLAFISSYVLSFPRT